MMRRIAPIWFTLALTGCAVTPAPVETPKVERTCPQTRPQMCTMHHDPVCGLMSSGDRKTFSNNCVACAEAGVVGYDEGACETND